jgi:hypothetical protein
MHDGWIGILILIAMIAFFWLARRGPGPSRAIRFRDIAAARRLTAHDRPDSATPVRLDMFDLFNRNTGFVKHLIDGTIDIDSRRVRITAGDYHGKVRQTDPRAASLPIVVTFVAIDLFTNWSQTFLLRRETLGDRLDDLTESNDIDFESIEFSKRYFVAASEKKFAYDLCDPRMMAFLLSADAPKIKIVGRHVLLTRDDAEIDPEELADLLDWAARFVEHVPRMLWNRLESSR